MTEHDPDYTERMLNKDEGLILKCALTAWHNSNGSVRGRLDFDDYRQEAAFAYLRALRQHDPLRSALSTYSVRAMKNALQRQTSQYSSAFDTRADHIKLAVEHKALRDQLPPPLDGQSDSVMRGIERTLQPVFSLDAPTNYPDTTLSDLVASTDFSPPEQITIDSLARDAFWEKINSAIERSLTPKENEILRLHLVDGVTQKEIGEHYNLTRARIGNIIKKARQKLQKSLSLNQAELKDLANPSS